jgi:hypothetical protein
MFTKPPLSTEHILHPDKYESYEDPIAITSAALPTLEGFRISYDNVSGEHGLAILLRQHGVSQELAEDAAEGWGGDRTVVFTPPDHKGKLSGTVGVLYSAWDDTADALEMFEALTRAMPSLSGGKAISKTSDRVDYEMKTGAIAIAERQGDAVLIVVGAAPARADEVRAQVWTQWTRK